MAPSAPFKPTHKIDCQCPRCQAGRGERKKAKKTFTAALNKGSITLLKQIARRENKSEAAVIEMALQKYFEEDGKMTTEELTLELLKEIGEDPSEENISDLTSNYGHDLDDAAAGDVGALVRIRMGLKLPVIS